MKIQYKRTTLNRLHVLQSIQNSSIKRGHLIRLDPFPLLRFLTFYHILLYIVFLFYDFISIDIVYIIQRMNPFSIWFFIANELCHSISYSIFYPLFSFLTTLQRFQLMWHFHVSTLFISSQKIFIE